MSIKMLISESLIDTIITNQFQTAHSALETNNSIEFSGFGKYVFNHKKAGKKMEKMLSQKAMFESIFLDENRTEQQRKSAKVKLDNIISSIEYLKQKLK